MKEGRYYYRPHRRSWGVWERGEPDSRGIRFDTFVRDFPTKSEASSFVYAANGWKIA